MLVAMEIQIAYFLSLKGLNWHTLGVLYPKYLKANIYSSLKYPNILLDEQNWSVIYYPIEAENYVYSGAKVSSFYASLCTVSWEKCILLYAAFLS